MRSTKERLTDVLYLEITKEGYTYYIRGIDFVGCNLASKLWLLRIQFDAVGSLRQSERLDGLWDFSHSDEGQRRTI